jgi:tetratricopeptide (TPR) repeat protein
MRRLVTSVAICLSLAQAPLFAQNGAVEQGRALFDRGHYEEARRVLLPEQQNPDAIAILGRIAAAQNDPKSAVELLERATRLQRRNADTWFELGNAYADLVLRSNVLQQPFLAIKAREALERAVQLDPNHLEARYALVQFYILAPAIVGGNEARALHEASQIRARDSIAGHRAFARIYLAQQKPDRARQEWIEAVQEQPDSPLAHDGLATFYLTVDKNFAAADQELETAVKLNPQWMPAWFNVGRLAAMTGRNLQRGKTALERYLSHAPKPDEPPASRAHFWLAKILERLGDTGAARQHYSVADSHPDPADSTPQE